MIYHTCMENTMAAEGHTMTATCVADNGNAILAKLVEFRAEIAAYTDADEIGEVITDISLRDIARAYEISFTGMRKGLARWALRGAVVKEIFYIPTTQAFANIQVTKMLVWQVEAACRLATDIKNQSNRKNGKVTVRKVAVAA